MGLFQRLKSPHIIAGLGCTGSQCLSFGWRKVAYQNPAIHSKMKENKEENQGMGINETYLGMFLLLVTGSGSHSQHRGYDTPAVFHSFWVIAGHSVGEGQQGVTN